MTSGARPLRYAPIPVDNNASRCPAGRVSRRRLVWMLWLVAAFAASCRLVRSGRPGREGPGPLSPLLAELARPAMAEEGTGDPGRTAGGGDRGTRRSGPRRRERAGRRRFTGGAVAALPRLREAGARVLGASRRSRRRRWRCRRKDLAAVASVPGVKAVWQAGAVHLRRRRRACEGGSVISEGLGQLQVGDSARSLRTARQAESPSASSPTPTTSPTEPRHRPIPPTPRRRRSAAICPASRALLGSAGAGQRPRRGPGGEARTRGGRCCRSSTTSPRTPRSPSPPPSKAKNPSPRTSKRWPASRRRRRRGRGDRRRRRLVRRALLPGRPGGGGDRQGHRRRGHLPVRGRQRQPLRSAETKSPPGKRPHSATRAAARKRSKSSPGFNGSHCMDFDPGPEPTAPSGSRSKRAKR